MIPSKLIKYLNFDWLAMVAMLFLLTTGLVAIYSLSLDSAVEGLNHFEKQVGFLVMGMAVFLLFSFLDYRTWRSYAGALYLVGIILMIAVLFFGKTIRGTTGWFDLGVFSLQPVELMKFFLIIALAKYFSQIKDEGLGPDHILVSGVYAAIPVLLTAAQPDMGSAVVMVVIWAGMMVWAGLRKEYILMLVLIGFIGIIFGWSVVLNDIQKGRIETFFNPEADPLGSGYNVIQSKVAIGSGGMGGKGLGHGSQSQLNFLPERHTDFIFAAIAEESGFIGAGIVLTLLWFLLYRIKRASEASRDFFGRLLTGGVLSMLFFQIFVNVGMNVGVVPVAGLSLPLLSYGGSFLLATMAAIGLAQSVWMRRLDLEVKSILDE